MVKVWSNYLQTCLELFTINLLNSNFIKFSVRIQQFNTKLSKVLNQKISDALVDYFFPSSSFFVFGRPLARLARRQTNFHVFSQLCCEMMDLW